MSFSTEKYDEKYNKLNPSQREAVDSIEGPVMVIAGPGTGKTQILTLRIGNILRQTDTLPESILAITFTESGVASMRKRLFEIIGTSAYRVTINTFHGFCNEIIKNFPEEFPRIIGARQITEIDQISILEKIVDELDLEILRPFGDRFLYVRDILGAINELKREGYGPQVFEGIVSDEKNNFKKIPDLYHDKGAHKGKMKGIYQKLEKQILKNTELSSIYNAYENELEKKRFYDYNDMIMESLKTLKKNSNLLLSLQEEYQYVLVDEHQDTNNAQNAVLELLMNYHENPNIFIVGDEKQAIFRFQGASLQNFYHIKNIYPKAKLINLTENYRSTQSILNSAHSLLSGEFELKSHSDNEDKPISIAGFSCIESENYFIAQDIKYKIDSGIEPHEISVLYRDNKDAFPVASMLDKFGLPYVIESDQDLFSDPDIRKILTLLKAINFYGEDEYLAEALHIDILNINSLDVYKIIRKSYESKISLYDLLETDLSDLSKQLSKWAKLSKNENLLKTFETIFEESGMLRAILDRKNVRERLETINSFFDEMKGLSESNPLATLSDFFDYLETIQKHKLFVKKKKSINTQGRIRLMTVHRSKGQEFKYVYVAGSHDGHFGNRRSIDRLPLLNGVYGGIEEITEDDNADERRLFYVAITRAKMGVVITYSKEGQNGREQLPSQFIGEIKEELLERLDTRSLEKDFEDKKHILFQSAENKQYEKIDQEFVAEILTKNGFSVTALNNYLDCPWNYFYSNLIRLPKAQDKHAMYGTAVHSALKDFFDNLKDRELSLSNLIERFEYYLSKLPLNKKDNKEVLQKGRKALSGYYDSYYSLWERNVLNEFPIKAVDIGLQARLTGKLDKIEFFGTGNEVNVVDYKTKKPMTRNQIEGNVKNGDAKYKRQLVFYKILLDNYESGKFKMISSELDFIEPDEKDNYKKEKFIIEDNEAEELKITIARVIDEIINLKFWDTKCDRVDCHYCGLRSIMK